MLVCYEPSFHLHMVALALQQRLGPLPVVTLSMDRLATPASRFTSAYSPGHGEPPIPTSSVGHLLHSLYNVLILTDHHAN